MTEPMQTTNELPELSQVIFDFFYHGGFTDLDDNDDDLAQELTSKLMTKLKPVVAKATSEAETRGFKNGLAEAYEIVGRERDPGYPESEFNVTRFKRAARQSIWQALSNSTEEKK